MSRPPGQAAEPVRPGRPGPPGLPGSALLEAVAVMDRLRSPGGCPWDAEQTHLSLAPYAIEEAYEVVEAAESGDRGALAEELGDLLLQVLFHARLASEADDGFDVDDVARGLVAKLVRRHPHVFARPGASAQSSSSADDPSPDDPSPDDPSADDAIAGWDAIKATEKQRAHVLDGIPVALPALQRAQKVVRRVERDRDRSGVVDRSPSDADPVGAEPTGTDPAARLGDALLVLVREAEALGVDAEAALRARVRALEQDARGTPGAGPTPGVHRHDTWPAAPRD